MTQPTDVTKELLFSFEREKSNPFLKVQWEKEIPGQFSGGEGGSVPWHLDAVINARFQWQIT